MVCSFASFVRRLAVIAALLLVVQPVLAQSDPGDEAANQESCTGTCSTCPGKASALVDLAGLTKALLAVENLDSAEESGLIRTTLDDQTGLETCVPFPEHGWVWLAFDAEAIDMAALAGELDELGFGVTSAVQHSEPMTECAEDMERIAVYVLLPADKDTRGEALLSFERFVGVDQLSYDRAYNLLIIDINPELTSATEIRDQLVEGGFAAGLPGEEMAQPAG